MLQQLGCQFLHVVLATNTVKFGKDSCSLGKL